MRISFSVITVTYNAANTLNSLIESLRSQTDRDFEWVVVDAASTDGTVDMFRAAGDVVGPWISEPDFGIYDALNKAIRLSQGEYYLVVGADDVLDPTAVANYKALINATGADILTAPVLHLGPVGEIRHPNGPAWLRGASAYITSHSVGSVYRKSLHERLGVGLYSRAYPVTADQLFIKRAIRAGASTATGDFRAGVIGGDGVSTVYVAGAMTDFFRVQLETERHKSLQVVLFILRLIRHFRRLIH